MGCFLQKIFFLMLIINLFIYWFIYLTKLNIFEKGYGLPVILQYGTLLCNHVSIIYIFEVESGETLKILES